MDTQTFLWLVTDAPELPADVRRQLEADPFDCLIVSTARNLDVTLVTSDEAIRDYPHVKRWAFSPRKTPSPRRARP